MIIRSINLTNMFVLYVKTINACPQLEAKVNTVIRCVIYSLHKKTIFGFLLTSICNVIFSKKHYLCLLTAFRRFATLRSYPSMPQLFQNKNVASLLFDNSFYNLYFIMYRVVPMLAVKIPYLIPYV